MVEKVIRRRDKRYRFVLLGIFVAVFLFSFLSREAENHNEVGAASLDGFDPGYIISDYTMSNYNSMTEAEIQAFLNEKGSCRDTRTYLADYYTSVSYHIKDGHFVCLAEETFGEGMAYGDSAPNGQSAAHIIWQTAQDYQINPQVLIVLLQKEQGLITDSWPNSVQYRSATGYGCPDTAACSSKYYGFKNQVRKAAEMFRTVLDGGWTNYPLGNNYIQYNPDANCGGSIVNIRSLATSALYRYTPYQPNDGALAAGYGTAYCGAYGNRNFYLYFEDWFGGITDVSLYSDVDVPRYMKVKEDTYYIDPRTGDEVSEIVSGEVVKFSTKIKTSNGDWCIRTETDTKKNNNRCVLRKALEELSFDSVDNTRYMIVKTDSYYINPRTLDKGESIEKGTVLMFATKILDSNGSWCIRTLEDTKEDLNRCIERKNLDNTNNYVPSVTPRYMKVKDDVSFVIPHTLEEEGLVESGTVLNFVSKILDKNGNWCLRTLEDTEESNNRCVLRDELTEVAAFVPSSVAREMKVAEDTFFINPYTMEKGFVVKEGEILSFSTKVIDEEGDWCIRTVDDSLDNEAWCIKRTMLDEI